MSLLDPAKNPTVDENGECVQSATVTKRVPGATKFTADQGAEQILCLQRQTVIKPMGQCSERD